MRAGRAGIASGPAKLVPTTTVRQADRPIRGAGRERKFPLMLTIGAYINGLKARAGDKVRLGVGGERYDILLSFVFSRSVMKLTAVFQKVPEGFIGFVEELPGANTQGATLEEVRNNLNEAVELVLEANRVLSQESIQGQQVIREPLIVSGE